MVDVAEIAGIGFDPWQVIGANSMTLTRTDGRWAAFEAFMAANRQQGKGTIIEGRQLAGLFVWEESLQVYTAHEFKTAQEMFLRIRTLIESTPTLDRMVSKIRTADGEEAIETKSGCRLKFMARSNSSGRGFTADTLYLDEAMKLKQRMMAALMPTMSARTITHNPQLLYFSSAGESDSEVQERVRERALARDSERLAYVEWSVPAWDDLPADERSRWASAAEYRADPEVHRRGNPGWNIRLDPAYVVNTELEQMSPEEFDRERLGIWAKLGGESVFASGVWRSCEDESSTAGDEFRLAIDVSPVRDSASIGLASMRPDGVVHVEVVDSREGTSWLPSELAKWRDKYEVRRVLAIAGSQAEALGPDLRREGIRLELRKMNQYAAACGRFYDFVTQGRIAHLGDEVLDAAVDGAQQSWRLDKAAWSWSRKSSEVDITSLVAVTLVADAVEARPSRDSGEVQKKSSGRIVVMGR